MCLCSKINKIYSAKGLSQGRPIPYSTVKQTSPRVMIKKTSYSSLNGSKR
ncbi:hypothetical protein HNR53_001831 [Bacillus benzoevorans]|uniref:Uncharacterized protein n=1 Tax=Bacillus benzoevorans TaxID=1456 RepID=A0A7X0LV39_9BACI|nr:hypothetical protein [Bacillus benzoevorans]